MKNILLSYGVLLAVATASPLQRGMEAKSKGDFESAARELAMAVKAEPKNPQAWLQYGTVLGWQKQYDEALAAVGRGLEITPKDYDLRMAHGRILAWQGRFADASAAFTELAKEYPGNEDILVMRGRLATWTGHLDQAETIYQDIIARNPNQVDALTGLGDVAAQRRKHDEANVYFQRAFEIDPSPNIQSKLYHLQKYHSNRLDVGVTSSSFAGGGKSDWWSCWTQYSAQTSMGAFWGKLEQGERFDQSDTVMEIGWEGNLLDGLETRLFSGGSPDAYWAAEWYVETDALWTPVENFPGVIAEFKYADYVPRGVFTSRLGIEQKFENGWKTSLKWVHQSFEAGQPTNGWILSLEKEYDSGYGWKLGVAQGAESLDGESLLATKVLESTTYFGGVHGQINDRLGWRVDLEYEDYDTGANRRGISAGLHWKF